MSKERLEELLSDLPTSIRHSGELEPLKQFVKEQAKRVQELEKDVKEWEIVNESWEEINTQIVEQNKRYREAIEKAKNAMCLVVGGEGSATKVAHDILRKALEDD